MRELGEIEREEEAMRIRFQRASDRVHQFQVIGERSSGTNYVHKLVRENCKITGREMYGWKHGFPSYLALPRNYLCIVVSRNASDWVRSMYSKPWHVETELAKSSFGDFIRSRWSTVVDRASYFSLEESDGRVGQILQPDRHPLTGEAFDNIFLLRTCKLKAHLSLFERGENVAFVNFESILKNPALFVNRLAAYFDIDLRSENVELPDTRMGEKRDYTNKDLPPKGLDAEDRRFMREQLDLDFEREIGYTYK